MDRADMGSNIGKDQALCSFVTRSVKEAARVPVWAKLTPATSDIAAEAGAVFRGGGDAITSSNTFPSLPLVDPETLEFEMHVDGYVSSGGMGGPAILPLSLAKMAQLTQAFPDKAFSGIGGISEFAHALNYFLLGCGTVQVCTAAMLDQAIGRSVIERLTSGYRAFLERHADRGWTGLDDFRGLLRERVVAQSRIRRPDRYGYQGGYEGQEGYAAAEGSGRRRREVLTLGRETLTRTMSTTLVKNGTIVTAADHYAGDLYIDKGVITLIGRGLSLPADTVVDASGMLVMPGGIDVHTHLDMPFGGTRPPTTSRPAPLPPHTAARRPSSTSPSRTSARGSIPRSMPGGSGPRASRSSTMPST